MIKFNNKKYIYNHKIIIYQIYIKKLLKNLYFWIELNILINYKNC